MGSYLLGYDLRSTADSAWADWDSAERRAQYLLRSDVPQPLSVNTDVWPSLGKRWADFVPHPDEIELPEDPAHAIIAVTIETSSRSELPTEWADLPDAPDVSAWRFLGYDIVGSFLVAGISNCGYSPGEKDTIDSELLSSINGRHLVTTLEAGRRFCEISNARVSEHAPFLVMAVYLVDGYV